MKIYLTTSAGTTEITNLITDVTLSGDYQTAARLLKFGVVSNHNDKNIPAVKCNLGSGIIMTENGENIFNGFIYGREKTTGDSIIDVSCYDRGIYLKRNQAVYKITGTPEQAVKRICHDFGLQPGNIAQTGVTINRKFIGTNLLDIIQTLYTMASEKTGKKYVIRFEDNLLCIVERSEEVVLKIDGETNLMSAVTSESAENLVDCVVVYDKEDKFISNFKNDDNIKMFGLMQRYLKKSDDEDAGQKAKKILADNDVVRKITVNNIGNTKCISGNAVTVREPYTGLNGLFYIDSDVHTWKNGQYYNKLTLNFNKIMAEKSAGSEEKKK